MHGSDALPVSAAKCMGDVLHCLWCSDAMIIQLGLHPSRSSACAPCHCRREADDQHP